MNELHFEKLSEINREIVAAFNRWENDESLRHLTRLNKNREDLEKERVVTSKVLEERMEKYLS